MPEESAIRWWVSRRKRWAWALEAVAENPPATLHEAIQLFWLYALHSGTWNYGRLREAKGRGIHTCVETCGEVPEERLMQAAAFTDHFLFDVKAVDSGLHKRLTGVGNERILSNLRALLAKGARVTLRCPMIPGANDNPQDLAALGDLIRQLTALHSVEILPYHSSGNAKYERLGRRVPRLETHVPNRGEQLAWLETLRRDQRVEIFLA